MTSDQPKSVEEYISGLSPGAAEVVSCIRATIRSVAPGARERMSYGMPTFLLGCGVIHYAAFKNHIGIYPPVREPLLAARVAPYRGDKGNLRLPLDQPIPYELIVDIVKARVAKES